MIISENINIQDDRLLNGLQVVLPIINRIGTTDDSDITIDCRNVRFVSPLFVLSLMIYAHGSGKNVSYVNLPEYMRTIHFDVGIQPDKMRDSEFIANMEGYANKTYIPIVNFPSTSDRNDKKDAIVSATETIIIRQLRLAPNIITGLKYMIGEYVDNIIEHSDSERGYVFAQAYPRKRFLDICIADNGITLLGSYQKLEGNEIASDIEAIQAANRGISTKNLPDAENRGYGITTSQRMLIDGLDGSLVMISGSALHIHNAATDKFLELPMGIRWGGTIIALRIPYDNKNFQYVHYIE